MPLHAVDFVSKRLRSPIVAILCIATVQLAMLVVSSCTEEPLPMGAMRTSLLR